MDRTVLIADDEPIIRMDLCEIFIEAGFNVVGEASDGFDAIDLCRKLRPELVIMDIKMPLLDGLKASKMIHSEQLGSCVVLVTSYSGNEFIEQAKNAGVMGYIIKPFNYGEIVPNIEVILAKHREITALKEDYNAAKKELGDRKFIDRAKAKIMEEQHLSERQAYEYIRKISMDKRCSMVEISKALLAQ